MELSTVDGLVSRASFGIASEGSFGPHPRIPFVAAGTEIVLMIERGSGVELVGMDVTMETNFASKVVGSLEEAVGFAAEVSFPSHGLIVMASEDGRPTPAVGIAKGIVDAGEPVPGLRAPRLRRRRTPRRTAMRRLRPTNRTRPRRGARVLRLWTARGACSARRPDRSLPVSLREMQPVSSAFSV